MDLAQLWLPILASAVVVFAASFVVWMVLPHHKKDIRVLPDEKALTDHLQQLNLPPGTYMWPNCNTPDEMKSDAFQARFQTGPWGSINIVGQKPNFGRNLILTFLFYVVVSLLVAYVTAQARGAGASAASVFRVAGTAALLAYCAGSIPGAIFMSKPGRWVLTDFLDNVAYGVLTGLVFALLWPAA